jgi:predicted phage-related endonuclease
VPEHVELDPAIAAWYEAARAAAAEIARYGEIRNRAIEHIQNAMGDAVEARIGGRPVVSWKPSKPSEYIDAKALRDELPDVAAKYTKLKAPARPFKILAGDE